MNEYLSRRDFLKFCALGAGATIFRPFFNPGEDFQTGEVARIAITSVSVYAEPDDRSKILYQRYRDDLVNLYYEVTSENPPLYNTKWFRVWGGYIHSAHLQSVEYKLNPVLRTVPDGGQLAEVTVPFTQTYWDRGRFGMQPLYRLYYSSTHWITGTATGPDGANWYKVKDELTEVEYLVRPEHLRPIPAGELTPISPDVTDKRVEISLSRQVLDAYENGENVLHTKISSGLPDYDGSTDGEVSTNTPSGEFRIYSKMPSKHMGDGNLTDDLNAYELPGVPWVSFFAEHGVACHGTYWHDNFGVPMSHGCVNMRNEDAKWLFRWTMPTNIGDRVEQTGNGTRVIVN